MSSAREHSPAERAESIVSSFQSEEEVRRHLEREMERDEPREHVVDALSERLEELE